MYHNRKQLDHIASFGNFAICNRKYSKTSNANTNSSNRAYIIIPVLLGLYNTYYDFILELYLIDLILVFKTDIRKLEEG